MKIAVEMPLSEYWKKKHPGGRPTLRTLQRQCERGDIAAVKRGGWYVIVDAAESRTGNDLVDMVLAS